jgi:hypothetical protein
MKPQMKLIEQLAELLKPATNCLENFSAENYVSPVEE